MLSACGRTVQGAPARRGAQLKSASRARLPVLYVAQPKRSAGAEAAQETSSSVISSLLPGAAAALPILLHADAALAKGGVYGILEGRTAALVHPAVMISLFFATGYAGYLGWQWRRTRTIGEEIKELKKQLPPAAEDGTRPASPVAAQVEQMEKVRRTTALCPCLPAPLLPLFGSQRSPFCLPLRLYIASYAPLGPCLSERPFPRPLS